MEKKDKRSETNVEIWKKHQEKEAKGLKKKIVGLVIGFKHLPHDALANQLLYKKISENIDEFIIIDTDKIQLKLFKDSFLDWDRFPYSVRDSFKKESDFLSYLKTLLPSKCKFYQPIDLSEFDEFLRKNDILLINTTGREFKYFGIYLKLKKNSIKHFIISNITNSTSSHTRHNLIQKLNYFLGRTIQNKIYALFCLLKIFNKVEIRFDNNQNFYKWWTENQKIKKYFFWKNSYFKKMIQVNSLAYDEFLLSNLKITNDYIVLIDPNLNHKDDVATRGFLSEEVVSRHYSLLNEHLEHLSKIFNKEVIVCIHPEYDLEKTQKHFKNFKVLKNRTNEFIYKSFLVVFYDSTVISNAFLLKKNIICLKPDFEWGNSCTMYKKDFGTVFLDITKEEQKKIEKKQLTNKLEIAKIGYDKYINTFIKTGTNETGIHKIINILKKYFNE